MQTIQHKISSPPPTPPEPKVRNESENKKSVVIHDITIVKNDRVTITQRSPNSSIILINSKPEDNEEEIDDMNGSDLNLQIDEQSDDANDMFTKDGDLLDSESGKDSDSMDLPDLKDNYLGGSAEEAFDKLKNETTAMMVVNSAQSENICTSAEVKEKISEILDNLEKEADDKSMLESNEMYNLPPADNEILESDTDMLEQKENLHPTMSSDSTSFQKYRKSTMAAETFCPKPTGPRMLYEIQSQDGFTYKSTSITEIWEKVFEAVQIARKAHGLAPLPEGPLADMCGHQMMGLKTNALKYLLEQLPGVENCSNYTPVYHKRAQSTLSQDASSGYCSDYEELRESYYGSARCEGYSTRSEYDMFSWLASRHRKQPVQICVPQNIDTELIPR